MHCCALMMSPPTNLSVRLSCARTKDDAFLRVIVQFKSTVEMDSGDTKSAIRTTDPFSFLPAFRGDKRTKMLNEMVDAIWNLGRGTQKAGACGILRVVFSHPSMPKNNVLEKEAEERYGHPVAMVRVDSLEKPSSWLGQALLSLSGRVVSFADRKIVSSFDQKRKGTEQPVGDGARPKRVKSGSTG